MRNYARTDTVFVSGLGAILRDESGRGIGISSTL
jgi:hypothetical protein